MAIEKIVVLNALEINVQNPSMDVVKRISIMEDGVEISRGFSRHVVSPDISADDLKNESADVQGIAAQVHTSDVKAAYTKHLEDSAPE